MERMPIAAEAGVKTANNGPMCLTPDGLAMIGPVASMNGIWLATGFNVGIGTGGGAAEILARWMTTGEPPIGPDAIHADRFGEDLEKEEALASSREV